MVEKRRNGPRPHPSSSLLSKNLIVKLNRIQPQEYGKENTFPFRQWNPTTSCFHVKEETPCLFHSEVTVHDERVVEQNIGCRCGNCSLLWENKEQSWRNAEEMEERYQLEQRRQSLFDDMPALKKITGTVQTQTAQGKKYKFTCKICFSEFNNFEYFKHHEIVHIAMLFGCPYCNATFANKTKLKNHVFIHLNKNYYQCVYCRAAFEKKSDLQAHTRTHLVDKEWNCDDCKAKFDTKIELEKHGLKHKYQSSGNLVHVFRKIRKNSNTEPSTVISSKSNNNKNNANPFFSCDKCKKLKFKSYNALRTHEVLHKRRGTYVCEICDAKFAQSHHRDHHRKMAH